MADARKTIDLVFQGHDRTSAAFKAVTDRTSAFAGNIQTATQPIADVTTSLVKLEAGLLVTGAAATAFAVKFAGDFDGAFREIATLIDVPLAGLEEFRSSILTYATTSTQSLDNITASIYTAISAGIEYTDSIRFLTTAEQLAVAGRADLESTTRVLISTLNAYGVSVDEAGRFSDVLFTTVKQGQTTLPELAEGFSKITQSASQLNVPIETVGAALATLTAAGVPTQEALTSLRAVMTALIKPSSTASATAEQLGIDFSAAAVKSKGLEVVLREVADATGGSEELMAQLFGRVEGLASVFTLTGANAGNFADNLVAMAQAAGNTEQAFDKMADAFELVNQQILNNFQVLLAQVGLPLLDEYGQIADAISEIFAALSQELREGGALEEISAFLESQFTELVTFFQGVAQALPDALEEADLSGFIDGLQAIGDALGGVFDGLDLTTAEGLGAAITAVADGFELLSQFTAGFIDSFGPAFDLIRETGGELLRLSPELARSAGEFGGFAKQANILSGALVQLLPSMQSLLAIVGVNQAVGLAGAFANAGKALSGQTGLVARLGQTGLAGAAGVAAFGIGTLANQAAELATGTSISTWATDLAIDLGLIDDEATNIVDGLNDVEPALDGLGSSARETGKSIEELDAEMLEIARGSRQVADETYSLESELAKLTDTSRTYTNEAGEEVGILYDLSDALGEGEAATDEMSASLGRGTLSFVGVEKATKEATKAQEKFNDAAEKMQHELKLAQIEAASKITTAQIEADAKTIVAAYESLNVTIDSTADLLGDLYGLYASSDINLREQFRIEEQIKLENERREEALDLQRRLTEEQIRMLKARADALASGQALINISGDGLKPHLEAFMWEILETIQVRTNAEGLGMLIGVDA